MAEAEDVIVDAARHATVWARALWRRHRPAPVGPPRLALADVSQRLDLLLPAALGQGHRIRPAQAALAPSWLQRLAHAAGDRGPHRLPRARRPVPLPATDGESIWLPPWLDLVALGGDPQAAMARYRVLALRLAVLARRGTPRVLAELGRDAAAVADVALVLEALSADADLVSDLPGTADAVAALRRDALAARPPLAAFQGAPRRLEAALQAALRTPAASGRRADPSHPPDPPDRDAAATATGDGPVLRPTRLARDSVALATAWVAAAGAATPARAASTDTALRARRLLWRDAWTGEPRDPAPGPTRSGADAAPSVADGTSEPPRSARLTHRPRVRDAPDDEDDDGPGAWMIQTAQPHESAADPMGLQRPTDRDADTAAEDFADAVDELPEARLVAAPGRPREVLLGEDAPDALARAVPAPASATGDRVLAYPEWDWRAGGYRHPGAFVHVGEAVMGDPAWVDGVLREHAALLQPVRRRFEMLRAQRVRLRRQADGDEIDLAAWIEARADLRAGLPMPQGLYETQRPQRRQMAIGLLLDTSGSTDAWVSSGRRVVDVAKEALLLVGTALEGLREPYAIDAFSGQGPGGVVVRPLKGFDEPWGDAVRHRIAGLEPEHYTRAGAALRHATANLARRPARHRLLLLLSDGKPNDLDDYEGRHGLEDVRQAVAEARLQGVQVFCLTIDRQAARYMPRLVGPHHYAVLTDPATLPAALLHWMRRLVSV